MELSRFLGTALGGWLVDTATGQIDEDSLATSEEEEEARNHTVTVSPGDTATEQHGERADYFRAGEGSSLCSIVRLDAADNTGEEDGRRRRRRRTGLQRLEQDESRSSSLENSRQG